MLSGIELKVLVIFLALLRQKSKTSLSPIFKTKKEVSELLELNVSILASSRSVIQDFTAFVFDGICIFSIYSTIHIL
jgi:hypothetical protein